MSINIKRIRNETPGCKHVIHLNNAGAALMPENVLSSIKGYLELELRIGSYEVEERACEAIERVYSSIAKLLGCGASEVAITESATRAWNLSSQAIPFLPGDKILTTESEYINNYITLLEIAKKTGAQVEILPKDEHGQVSLEVLTKKIDDKVKLISITYVPVNEGLINPAIEIGKIAKQAGILYILDASQAIGQFPISVKEIGCDILCATGRKFLRGPRGIGFLYIREEIFPSLERPFFELNPSAFSSKENNTNFPDIRRFENTESNPANRIGLGAAIDYAINIGISNIWQRIRSLTSLMKKNLESLPEIKLQDQGLHQCGIITFTVKGMCEEILQKKLIRKHINVSISTIEDGHLNMKFRNLKKVIRISIHYYNSEEEIKHFCNTLTEIYAKYSSSSNKV